MKWEKLDYVQKHPRENFKESSTLKVSILRAIHTSNLSWPSPVSVLLLGDRLYLLSRVSSGALEGSGHMIRLRLHPALHLSNHLTHSQRVTAVHCGPVFTHAASYLVPLPDPNP